MPNEKTYQFDDLVEIMTKLRAPGGCPWDREQTHASIKPNLIEEAYELSEALDSGDGAKMADESGDLLLQIVFHASIGKDAGEYSIDDVTDSICRKMIHRHPHVFGDADLTTGTADEVLNNWDVIKRGERGQGTVADEMRGISKYLPNLIRADKVIRKAIKRGYEFAPSTAEDGIGAKLWEAVRLANEAGVDPELALGKYIANFIDEFEQWECGSE